jgi:hypothetical protein
MSEWKTETRPIPDAMREVRDAAANVSDLINEFRAAGEVTIQVDLFTMKNALTLHIPIPKS